MDRHGTGHRILRLLYVFTEFPGKGSFIEDFSSAPENVSIHENILNHALMREHAFTRTELHYIEEGNFM